MGLLVAGVILANLSLLQFALPLLLRFLLQVVLRLAEALVPLGVHNGAEIVVVHADSGELGQVACRGKVLDVLEPMGAIEESLAEQQLLGHQVHFPEEVLGVVGVVVELVALDLLGVLMGVLASEQLLAEVLREGEGRVVTARQHQTVEQLVHGEDIARFEVGGSASNVGSYR